jgi:hypothetical protein
MTDPVSGKVTGIRLRAPGGAKFAFTGGKDGLFLPRDGRPDAADSGLLLVTEGATDAIAGYNLGFTGVVGRPSCTGGTRPLIALTRTRKPAAVAIVADADAPGIAGAEWLAVALTLYCQDVRIITPPTGYKDLRSCVLAGATRFDINHRIRSAVGVQRPAFRISLGTHA